MNVLNQAVQGAANWFHRHFGGNQPMEGAVAGEEEAPAQIHQGPLTSATKKDQQNNSTLLLLKMLK